MAMASHQTRECLSLGREKARLGIRFSEYFLNKSIEILLMFISFTHFSNLISSPFFFHLFLFLTSG